MAETIKVNKKQDIAEVIRQIKSSSAKEIVLDIEKKSVLFMSSENLKLIRKTGEVLGKKVLIETTDDNGLQLARKASMLAGDVAVEKTFPEVPKIARSDIRPRFSDIMGPKRSVVRRPMPKTISKSITKKPTISTSSITEPLATVVSGIPKFSELKSSKYSNFSKYFLLALVILVVGVFALAVLLPKATITVAARSEPVSRDLEINVDRLISVADPSRLQIPGFMMTKEVSETQTFEATGASSSGKKASGSVVIHNNTSNTLTLKASTTALLVNGKRYSFVTDATGIKGNGAANVPIQIVAEQAGDNYNLPVNTRFDLANAALGQTNQVYATSSTAISGGTSTQGHSVSQADIDQATQKLIQGAIVDAQADGKIYIDNGVKAEVLAKTPNKEVGDEASEFDMTIIARISGLAVREDDIISVAVAKINEVLSSDKYLLGDEHQKFTARYKTSDLVAGRGVLSVHFETLAAYEIDNSNLGKILAGKNEAEIKEILLSKPEVDDVQVKFWPAWLVHKAPRLNGKIEIKSELKQ